MLSSTWQVTGAFGTPAELIERAPYQRDFKATSVPGVLEMDGTWVRQEEEADRQDEHGSPERVRASILRREFILDAPLKDASERGWTMSLTFGGFSGPLYAWVDGIFIGFCADGFIPTAFDVTDALQPTHTHAITALLLDSPVCCHGLFREVSLEARPPAHIVDLIPEVSHDGRNGSLRLRIETSDGANNSIARAALLSEGQQEEIWSASTPAGDELQASSLDVLAWSAEEPALYALVVTLSDEEAGTQDTVAMQVGFRGLAATAQGVSLAGRPLVLRGVRRNECHPRTGLAVGLPEMLEDIVWCKRHGVNAIEISDAPVHARFYELADEYGLYVIDRPSALHRSGEALAEAVEAAIRRDRAHPSVIAWSLGDSGQEELARSLDPTRPLMGASGFPELEKVRGEELHYAPVSVAPSYSGVTVRNHMTFTSTGDLEFLCRTVEDGHATWEYPAFIDVAPGETAFLPVEWPASGVREVSVRLSYGTGWAPAGFEIGRGFMPAPPQGLR